MMAGCPEPTPALNTPTDGPYLASALAAQRIAIRGARTHNLKNIDLDIPRNQLVVITGLSGSGKSSLAFDTLPEMDVGQHGDSGFVEQALAEFFRIATTRELTRLGDIRPSIEGATRTLTMHTRHIIEQTNNEFTSLMEDIAHTICIILRAIECLYRCPLRNL
jgi:excinuclease UvrABC ATPase subunit